MPWEKQFDPQETLKKAMNVFWARGYNATSMRDLVECTGLGRGSIYATYTDKRSLFLAALRLYDDEMRGEKLAEMEARNPPREAIRALFDGFTTAVAPSGENRGCFLTNTALELAAHDDEARAIVAHAQEQMEAFFRKMIAKGQRDGTIGAEVDPAVTARGLLASLIGVVVLSRSRPDRKLLRSIVDDAMNRLG